MPPSPAILVLILTGLALAGPGQARAESGVGGAASGDDATGGMDTEQSHHGIAGGEVTTDWPATVGLLDGARDHGVACTGTLIRPDVVLTAAHCIDQPDALPSGVFFGAEIDGPGVTVAIDRAVPHPDWDVSARSHICCDIGLLFLAESVDEVEPVQEDRTDISELLGLEVVTVGYGITQGTDGEGFRKAAQGTAQELFEETYYLTAPIDGGGCEGDSGGPVYLDGDPPQVVGVHTFGVGSDCQFDLGGNTRIDIYADWIVEEAGDWVEASPAPPPAADGISEGTGSGCSCSTVDTRTSSWWVLLALVALGTRRRRPRSAEPSSHWCG